MNLKNYPPMTQMLRLSRLNYRIGFLEQVGQGPPPDEAPTPIASQPALIDEILEPPTVTDMPDWLQEEPDTGEFDSIFANTLEEDAPVAPPQAQADIPVPEAPAATPTAIELDTTDPWVEAFDEEYERGQADINEIPDWYAEKVNDPERMAVVEQLAEGEPSAELLEANLEPETELVQGELEEVPDWLQEIVPEQAEALEPADIPDWLSQDIEVTASETAPQADIGEMPDWLKNVEVEATEIPDWLVDTITTTSEQTAVAPSTPTPAPSPAIVPALPASYSPAPVPVQASNIDVAETLNNARSRANANDIDASLHHYEMLIRANVELDAVVSDLTNLAEKFKKTPPVYRVLGDGLMRQGKLQAALDIYRKALNQL